jgi:PAS domain S-box-containing protein
MPMSPIQTTEEALREQARLLDLTHDSIFVRDMDDMISYWNRGAEELYGWARDEAIGKVTHELMKTSFPLPLDQINTALLRDDRWEGELVHTKRDGTRVVVASRWALQRDAQGRPIAVLETNNDITERKRAERLTQQVLDGIPDMASITQPDSTAGGLRAVHQAQFGPLLRGRRGQLCDVGQQRSRPASHRNEPSRRCGPTPIASRRRLRLAATSRSTCWPRRPCARPRQNSHMSPA